MKKILLLGGSTQQIPAIEYANKIGCSTILCDYLHDNPGQNFADKFYCVSTTDKAAILDVAIKENVDGIVAYASDPAAPTASFVAEKLNLPTNLHKSVEILAYKDKFRKFLYENNLNCPKSHSYSTYVEAMSEIHEYTFPVMVKPVDSSGSKGVNKVEQLENLETAFEDALSNSRSKSIIVEEFIEQDHQYMIGGDFFVVNGEVTYWGLLNCHRNKSVNPLIPVGKSYPPLMSVDRLEKIKIEVNKVLKLLNIHFGGFNLEVMIDKDNRVFLIEIGPRNGGNMIPDLLKMANNVDLVGATVETAIGNEGFVLNHQADIGFYSSYNLHSAKKGYFEGLNLKGEIERNIIRQTLYKEIDDSVELFDGANKAIGIVFLKFDTEQEQLRFWKNPEKWIEVKVR